MSFINKFYIVEDIKKPSITFRYFTDFTDALDGYVSVSSEKYKALGVESESGDRLYFVMCINGEDIITGDYASAGGEWSCPEVKEINDALENYFKIKQKWPVITKARQEDYENDILGFYDNIPELCGNRGRACRNMENESGASSMLCCGCSLAVYCSIPTYKEARENHVKADMFSMIDQFPEAEISDEALSIMCHDPTIGSRLVSAIDNDEAYSEAYWDSLLRFAEEEAKRYNYISDDFICSEEDIGG